MDAAWKVFLYNLCQSSCLCNILVIILQQLSPCMERAVLDQLVNYFEARLAAYPTTLTEDGDMVMTLQI